MIRLGIVSPCYNEAKVIISSVARLNGLFDSLIERKLISADSFIMFVNDGSKDNTWELISQVHTSNVRFKGLNLAHNVGHQYAIMAGMMTVKDWADAIITIDADLQDDLNAIENMIKAYEEGNDIVYGVKVSRTADPLLKRMSAVTFYKLQEKMGVQSVFNHADFRLMSKRALNMLSQYHEKNLYLRGLIPMIGLPSTTVDDVISERLGGESKYTLSKMLNLALDGITSFSIKPIYMILDLGILFLIISLVILVDVIYSLIVGSAVSGWASILLSIWMCSGMLLVCMSMVGIYIGKIYKEVKARPLYHIQDILG